MSDDLTPLPGTWHRPDGTDTEVYKALAAEGRHRLSWEWLIRIDEFQRQCHAVRIGFVDENWVAAAWGMYRFKPFHEPYLFDRKPRFLVSKVRQFHTKRDQRVRHVALGHGEIAFVLDVDRMVRCCDSRDAQIASLTRLLDAAIDRRRNRRNVTPTPKTRVNDLRLEECLQLCDLLRRNVPLREVKERVRYLRDATSAESASGRLRDMKYRIEELMKGLGYLKVAARAHSGAAPT